MPTNQLDVFLVCYTGNFFISWANKVDINLHDDTNPAGKFLDTQKKEREFAFRREPALVLYLLDPKSLRASIGFYACFTSKDRCANNNRILSLEGLMDIKSTQRWGEGAPETPMLHLDMVDCLKRAYRYLDADRMFMDYEPSEDDLHRIIMPDDSYTKLQQLGRPVPDSPFAVTGFEESVLKLVPFNLDFARRFLKPTADYHQI